MRASFAREVTTGIASVTRVSQRNVIRTRPSQLSATSCRGFTSQTRRFQDSNSNSNSAAAPKPASRIPVPAAAPVKPAPASQSEQVPVRSLTEGLDDPSPVLNENEKQVDWSRSFHGISSSPFSAEAAAILTQDIPFDDIEIKPDGIIYLPEIKYRRILNKAFGPGGWGLVPRGETIVTQKLVTREYGLVAGGRLVSIARGEQNYFDPDGIPTATEGCKSNSLMRCCKDLGIASELWDPRFVRKFIADMGKEMIVEHMVTKKRRKHFMRKDDELKYPLKEIPITPPAANNQQRR